MGVLARVAIASSLFAGCAGGPQPVDAQSAPGDSSRLPPLLAEMKLATTTAAAYEGDGEDDGQGAPSPALRRLVESEGAVVLEPVRAPTGAHPLTCDMAPFAGQLHVSFAVRPIDIDGAQVHRLSRDGTTWELAFDWDRGCTPGETHEMGGQGIPRLRVIGERLFATDGDAPLFGGFGLTNAPFEDYIFVASPDQGFADLGTNDSPPANSLVLPLAFHVFDVIRYNGALVASGGTAAIEDRSGTRYPGGLFVGDADAEMLLPRYFPGQGEKVGVVRATYLHRFNGRLYAGFQNNSRRIRWDVGVLAGDPTATPPPPLHLARLTPDGGWLTRRFASGQGMLYWVAGRHRSEKRGGALFASSDGDRFEQIELPSGAGDPQDLLIVAGSRILLTSTGLYRAGSDHRFELWARAPAGNPFASTDTFCSVPLAAAGDHIYVGAARGGVIYRVAQREP